MTQPLTSAQIAWLDALGSLVGDPDAGEDDDTGDDAADGARAGNGSDRQQGRASSRPRGGIKQALPDAPRAKGEDDKGLVGLGPEDIPGLLTKKFLGPLTATCIINNNTQQTLRLDAGGDEIDDDSGKTMGIAHGEYKEFPPSLIKSEDQSSKFTAVNKETDLVIVTVRTAGIEGFVRYLIDDQKTAWVLHFNNPRAGDNTADARLEGPNAAQFESPKPLKGGGNDAKFLYVLNPKGGPKPNPGPNPSPNPNPSPQPEVRSSCQITVTNNTPLPLTFLDSKHERGNFMSPIPTSVPPGGAISFASVETPNAKDQGCKGFIIWQVGSVNDAVWLMEWDNPEGAKNTSSAEVTPPTAFKSVDQIGQGDENVPVTFTLSGSSVGPSPGPGPGPQPGPGPKPPPEPEPAFDVPVASKQPTLRKGDKSDDGWVEYAQLLLNFQLKMKLKEDGDFGNATLAAVLKFQKAKGLQVDGTVGNQTWAALREGAPEKPSTDGRKPHEFVEHGVEARWMLESQINNKYFKDRDRLDLAVQSVGDKPLDASTEATVRVTPPGGKVRALNVKLKKDDSGRDFSHVVALEKFRKAFPSVPPDAAITGYKVEAFLPKELGGDFYSGNVRE